MPFNCSLRRASSSFIALVMLDASFCLCVCNSGLYPNLVGAAGSQKRNSRGSSRVFRYLVFPVKSRILWLNGLEKGLNLGLGVDSKSRYIYIHGTIEEGLIGKPASNGCIRMYNSDVITLFDKVDINTQVWIF
mgnify:CR=1 FL=1